MHGRRKGKTGVSMARVPITVYLLPEQLAGIERRAKASPLRDVAANERTAPSFGAWPRSYLPAAWFHHVCALPKIATPEISRA